MFRFLCCRKDSGIQALGKQPQPDLPKPAITGEIFQASFFMTVLKMIRYTMQTFRYKKKEKKIKLDLDSFLRKTNQKFHCHAHNVGLRFCKQFLNFSGSKNVTKTKCEKLRILLSHEQLNLDPTFDHFCLAYLSTQLDIIRGQTKICVAFSPVFIRTLQYFF